jgi:hypothetical protein
MTADVRYKKNKHTHSHDAWIVTVYETPYDIMAEDNVTMSRLYEEIYGKAYKGDKHIYIKGIKTKKVIGKENKNTNEDR